MPIKLDEVVPNYDDTLAGRLLHYVENPDSMGYKKGNWYSPKYDKRYDSKKKNYDINNFGMGVDRNTNQYVKDGSLKFHKDKQGREYLTETEERNVRNHSIAEAEKSYNNRLAYAQKKYKSDVVPSEMKKALTVSAIYNLGSGKVANELFEDDSLMKALLNGTDKEYSDKVNYYYDLNNKANRSERTTDFLNQYIKEQKAAKKKKKDNGGFLRQPAKSWNDLSLAEKADMMKVAVQNGVYDLDSIRGTYNEYDEGGDTSNPYLPNGKYYLRDLKEEEPTYSGYVLPTVEIEGDALKRYNELRSKQPNDPPLQNVYPEFYLLSSLPSIATQGGWQLMYNMRKLPGFKSQAAKTVRTTLARGINRANAIDAAGDMVSFIEDPNVVNGIDLATSLLPAKDLTKPLGQTIMAARNVSNIANAAASTHACGGKLLLDYI